MKERSIATKLKIRARRRARKQLGMPIKNPLQLEQAEWLEWCWKQGEVKKDKNPERSLRRISSLKSSETGLVFHK